LRLGDTLGDKIAAGREYAAEHGQGGSTKHSTAVNTSTPWPYLGDEANPQAIADAQTNAEAMKEGLSTAQRLKSLLVGGAIVAGAAVGGEIVGASEAAPLLSEAGSTALSSLRSAVTLVKAAAPVVGSTIAAGATKVASAGSDLYEEAGKLVTSAENFPGLLGKMFNLGMGLIKGSVNGWAHVQPGADLKATGLIAANRAAQQIGIQVARMFQAAMKIAGL